MKRLEDLIMRLNLLEKYIASDSSIKALEERNKILNSLCKTRYFKSIYEMSKTKQLNLNKYLLPYKLFIDNDNKKVYALKSIKDFSSDYDKAFSLIKQYREEGKINSDEYVYLENALIIMRRTFAKQFRKTMLDKLSDKEKIYYQIYNIKINNIFKKMCLMRNFNELEKQYEKSNKREKLAIINKLMNEVENCYYGKGEVEIIDIGSSKTTLRIKLLEQIYIRECKNIVKKEKDADKIVIALMEDVDIFNSNYMDYKFLNSIRKNHKY